MRSKLLPPFFVTHSHDMLVSVCLLCAHRFLMLHVVLYLTRIANTVSVISCPRVVAAMEDSQLTAVADDIGDVPLQLLGCAAWDAKPLEREGDQMAPTSFAPAAMVAQRAGKILQRHMRNAATSSGGTGAPQLGPTTDTYVQETPLVDLSDDDNDLSQTHVGQCQGA